MLQVADLTAPGLALYHQHLLQLAPRPARRVPLRPGPGSGAVKRRPPRRPAVLPRRRHRHTDRRAHAHIGGRPFSSPRLRGTRARSPTTAATCAAPHQSQLLTLVASARSSTIQRGSPSPHLATALPRPRRRRARRRPGRKVSETSPCPLLAAGGGRRRRAALPHPAPRRQGRRQPPATPLPPLPFSPLLAGRWPSLPVAAAGVGTAASAPPVSLRGAAGLHAAGRKGTRHEEEGSHSFSKTRR